LLFVSSQLLLVCCAERSEESHLSATVWRGTSLPPARGVGVTSPRLFSGVWLIFTAVLLLYGTDDLSSGRESRLLRSHRRSPLRGRLSAAACALYSTGGMDLGPGGDIVVYVFAPDTSQFRGRHQLCPGGLATVIRQVLAPPELGLAPTANSPGSGSQTSLFSCFCMSTWTPLKPGLCQASLCRFHRPS
jgi:hypothetical protein